MTLCLFHEELQLSDCGNIWNVTEGANIYSTCNRKWLKLSNKTVYSQLKRTIFLSEMFWCCETSLQNVLNLILAHFNLIQTNYSHNICIITQQKGRFIKSQWLTPVWGFSFLSSVITITGVFCELKSEPLSLRPLWTNSQSSHLFSEPLPPSLSSFLSSPSLSFCSE